MGLFNFVKEAGEKLWDAVNGGDDQNKKLQDHINKLGLPDSDKVDVKVNGDTVTVTGDGLSQELKEKILIAAGNVAGITKVEDKVTVTDTAVEPALQVGVMAAIFAFDHLFGRADCVVVESGPGQ